MGILDKLFGGKPKDEVVSDEVVEIETGKRYQKGNTPYRQFDLPDFSECEVDPSEILAGCKMGDAEDLYLMGMILLLEPELLEGGIFDTEEASEFEDPFWCFSKSSEQGHAKAIYQLGPYYELGFKPVEKDTEKALSLYKAAAELGYVESIYYVGVCYTGGMGTEKDDYEAAKWYKRAAELNYPPALNIVGTLYHQGICVPQNDKIALSYFEKAAEMDEFFARFNLALFYRQGKAGLQIDNAKAEQLIREAANFGHMPCVNDLGECYEYGWMGFVPDPVKAVSYYQTAARRGYSRAEYNMGRCCENGIGVKKDLQKAASYYQRAARRGYADAQDYLGNCYFTGKLKLNQNPQRGYQLYEQAAAQGQPHATHMLGVFHEFGYGVIDKDLNKATHYYQLAKQLGYKTP